MVKSLRAILLLVVYTAFSASTGFARHTCDEFCTPQAVEHGSHSEAGIPPTECTEKEAVTNQSIEHRSGSTVKFSVGIQRSTARSEKPLTHFIEQAQELNTGLIYVSVPLYISNCVYRL